MSSLTRYEVHIVEDDFFAREALAMHCAKHESLSVRTACSFAELGKPAYKWARRGGPPALEIALIAHDDPLIIRTAMTWFKENIENVIVVVMLGGPAVVDVPAILDPCLRGIILRDEVGYAIGEILLQCTKRGFVTTPQIVPQLFPYLKELPAERLTILTESDPFGQMSDPIALTMRMFCIWGMSNEQIARHFGVSQNTIASRIRAGHLALDTSSRDEAMRKIITSVTVG